MTIITEIARAVDEHEARCMFATTESVVRTALAAMLAEFAKPENVERLAKIAVMAVDKDTYVGSTDDLRWVCVDGNVDFKALILAILAEMAKC